MWRGKVTDELKELAKKYNDIFGIYPDGYDQIEYSGLNYNRFKKLIEKSIETGKELVDIV